MPTAAHENKGLGAAGQGVHRPALQRCSAFRGKRFEQTRFRGQIAAPVYKTKSMLAVPSQLLDDRALSPAESRTIGRTDHQGTLEAGRVTARIHWKAVLTSRECLGTMLVMLRSYRRASCQVAELTRHAWLSHGTFGLVPARCSALQRQYTHPHAKRRLKWTMPL